MTWNHMTSAQARALGRIGKTADCPGTLLHMRDPEDKKLIVVSASSRDKRRWDISKGGKITARER